MENAFATRQLAFLATRMAFFDIGSGVRRNQIAFPFFSFLFAAVIDLLLGLLAVKKTSKNASSRRAIFTMEQPGVVAGNFTQLFEHFCRYLRLH